MLLILAALAAPSLPVRTVAIPPAAVSKPVRIDCPIGQLTQIVFPERLVLLKASAGAADDLGVAAERSSPQGMVSVKPVKGATGTLELRGPTLVLTILVRGVERGGPSEIHLTLATPTPAPSPSPSPRAAAASRPAQTTAPTPSPSPMTLPVGRQLSVPVPSVQTVDTRPSTPAQVFSAPPISMPPSPARAFDVEGLKTAKAVSIGRREGLPGEPEMVLDTAYTGTQAVWLRFNLSSPGGDRISSVTWEGGEIGDYVQEPAGKDLRILVQLPKAKVNRRTRVILKTKSGGTYRFALSAGTFTDFLKGLVR